MLTSPNSPATQLQDKFLHALYLMHAIHILSLLCTSSHACINYRYPRVFALTTSDCSLIGIDSTSRLTYKSHSDWSMMMFRSVKFDELYVCSRQDRIQVGTVALKNTHTVNVLRKTCSILVEKIFTVWDEKIKPLQQQAK